MRGNQRSPEDHRLYLTHSNRRTNHGHTLYHQRTPTGARGRYILCADMTMALVSMACTQNTGKSMPDDVALHIHKSMPPTLKYEYYRDCMALNVLKYVMTIPSKRLRLQRIIGMHDRRQRDHAFKRCISQALNVALGWQIVGDATPIEECAVSVWRKLVSMCYHAMLQVVMQECFILNWPFAMQRSLHMR